MAKKPRSAADVLDRTADLLAERGWCQGEYRDGAGRLCVEGAMLRASSSDRLVVAADKAFRLAINDSTVPWNDAPERTKEEVIAKLREVATKLAAKERA